MFCQDVPNLFHGFFTHFSWVSGTMTDLDEPLELLCAFRSHWMLPNLDIILGILRQSHFARVVIALARTLTIHLKRHFKTRFSSIAADLKKRFLFCRPMNSDILMKSLDSILHFCFEQSQNRIIFCLCQLPDTILDELFEIAFRSVFSPVDAKVLRQMGDQIAADLMSQNCPL
jgi:hypothetical protein